MFQLFGGKNNPKSLISGFKSRSSVLFSWQNTSRNFSKFAKVGLVSFLVLASLALPLANNLSVSAGNQIQDKDFEDYRYIVNLDLKDGTKIEDYFKILPKQKVEKTTTTLPNSLENLNKENLSATDLESSKQTETVSNYNYLITSLASKVDLGGKNQPISYTVKSKDVAEVKSEFNNFENDFLDIILQVKTDNSGKFNEFKEGLKPILDKFSTSTLQVADFKLNFLPTYLTNVSLLANSSTLDSLKSNQYVKTADVVDLQKIVEDVTESKLELQAIKSELDAQNLPEDQKQARLNEKTQEVLTQNISDLATNNDLNSSQPKLDIYQDLIEKIDQVATTKTSDSRVEVNTSKLKELGLNQEQINQVTQATATFNQLPEEKRDGRDQISNKVQEIKDEGLAKSDIEKTVSGIFGGVKAEAAGYGCYQINPSISWSGINIWFSGCVKQAIVNGAVGSLFAITLTAVKVTVFMQDQITVLVLLQAALLQV